MEMDRLWWVGLVWILLQIHVNGCLEAERNGLLQIKAFIYPNGTSPYQYATSLQSWDSNDKKSNCCDWEQVHCNNNGRVVQLLLNGTYRYFVSHNIPLYLNSSLFLPFRELIYLDLSYLWLAGWVDHEGFERLSELRKLEVLELKYNQFNNSILPSLAALSSLKTLSLAWNHLKGSIHTQAFLNMSNLEELDLSGNGINGFTKNEGLKSLSKLKILSLMGNKFKNASILQSLGALSSLTVLDLSRNELRGMITRNAFLNMGNLEELDLSYNSINSFGGNEGLKSLSKLKILHLRNITSKNASILLQSFGALSSLTKLDLQQSKLQGMVTKKGMDELSNLEELYLDQSSIDMSFIHNAGVITSLRVLSLKRIVFNSTLPNQGWCELFNLEELDLSENGLSGTLPSCMRNLTSLRFLDLSFNHFSENIAFSPLTSLTSLEYLLLSDNHFVIPISFASFYNHSKLKVISGDNNILSDQTVLHSWNPRFQLKVFSLSNCKLNNFSETNLFSFLYHQHDLRVVDLSDNNLTGGTLFLSWLLGNNTQLEYLNLRNNFFSGPFPPSHHPYNITKSIDISNNQIHGQLPTNIGSTFPNLGYLNMSWNELEGSIPTSIGDLHSLWMLDLSNNNLSGHIPEHLAIGCSSLSFFRLSKNNLHGRIFPQVMNLTSLEYLYLDNNHFEGNIPDSLPTASDLWVLDISNNNMSGNLPIWIGNMDSLNVLVMSKNHFDGPIPVELCKLDLLYSLDLSNNNLSGPIPSCFNSSSIEHVHLNQNRLSGTLTHAFSNCSSLVTLDLRENNISGNIPSWIGNLSSLGILLLRSNSLEGEIPVQLCHLKELTILDLSRNNLSHYIPHCFSDIPFKAMAGKFITGTIYLVTDWRSYMQSYMVGTRLSGMYDDFDMHVLETSKLIVVIQVVAFTTKSGLYEYSSDHILGYMSGVDLSCNLLTGEIPSAIGKLSEIRVLNLSHNKLIGSIPTTFSDLKQVESLDLSYNYLNGTIPFQLIELNALEVFSVSHNNLSGSTPERKAQFATFEESSYEGNSLLCGPPLLNNCTTQNGSPSTLPNFSEEEGFMDMGAFYVTFTVSFIIALLGVIAVLYINPYWRQAWFHIVNVCGISCYYFVVDCFLKLSNKRGV